MKILILSAHTIEIDDYAKLTVINKQEYADKHGYDYINLTSGFDSDRHPSWSKTLFIKQYLSDYDYVFWMDSDALFMRYDIKLESFINGNEKYDLIFENEDWNTTEYKTFNAGVFFTKNTPFSFDFLDKVYEPQYLNVIDRINGAWWEQGAMWEIVNNEKYDNILYIPNRPFNAVIVGYIGEEHAYREGDFVCHFAGKENRTEYIKEYLCNVKK